MRIVAIDFETANERRDSACAVGLAWIEGGRVARRASRLIRPPEMRFSPGNIRIHGILPADVRDSPCFPEAMAEFLPDLAGGLVLAHNAAFDISVLSAGLGAWGRPVPELSYLCTLQVARRVFPDPAGCGLAKVAGRLGIGFAHHDAGEDAYACAEIALAAVRETGAVGVADLPRVIGVPARTLAAGYLPDEEASRSTAARALFAAGATSSSSRRGSDTLRFRVRGSTGNRYGLTLEERAAELYLRCDCPAGRNRRRCRHVDALVEGDVTDLISGNLGDVERLRLRIAAAGGDIAPSRLRHRPTATPDPAFGPD